MSEDKISEYQICQVESDVKYPDEILVEVKNYSKRISVVDKLLLTKLENREFTFRINCDTSEFEYLNYDKKLIATAKIELVATTFVHEKDRTVWLWAPLIKNWNGDKVTESDINNAMPDIIKNYRTMTLHLPDDVTTVPLAYIFKYKKYDFIQTVSVSSNKKNIQILGLKELRFI